MTLAWIAIPLLALGLGIAGALRLIWARNGIRRPIVGIHNVARYRERHQHEFDFVRVADKAPPIGLHVFVRVAGRSGRATRKGDTMILKGAREELDEILPLTDDLEWASTAELWPTRWALFLRQFQRPPESHGIVKRR